MSTKRIATNTTLLYFIMAVVIVVAFMLLGGGLWLKRVMHGSMSVSMANWNWAQILICLGLGFLLGILVNRRKW